MEFQNTLTIISTVIGIVVGLLTILEKISKINISRIFSEEIRFPLLFWSVGTTLACFIGSVIYLNLYQDYSAPNVTSTILQFIPWAFIFIVIYFERKDLNIGSRHFWNFIAISALGAFTLSYVIAAYTFYFAMAMMIIWFIYIVGSIFTT